MVYHIFCTTTIIIIIIIIVINTYKCLSNFIYNNDIIIYYE